MSDFYRDDKESAVENLREVLRENEQLRARVRALESGTPQPSSSRVGVWVALSMLLAGAAAGIMMFSRSATRTKQASSTPNPMPLQQQLPPPIPPVPPPTPPSPAPAEVPVAAAVPEQEPAGLESGRQIADTLRRSHVMQQCWEAAMQRDARHASEHVSVRLEVDAEGRARANVAGAQDPQFAQCITQRASAVHFEAGSAITVQVAFNFVSAN